jgi:hypothetical protein
MKTTAARISATTAAVIALGLCANTSYAAILITLEEIGGDVVATGSGSARLDGLVYANEGSARALLGGGTAIVAVGSTVHDATRFWIPGGGPSNFGSGASVYADSGSGDKFGFYGPLNWIVLPKGYSSGAPLSAVSTWTGATFASLGVTPGSYTWTWGSGATADSLTLKIGAVPEPGEWAMVGGVLCLAGVAARRSRRI